MLLQVPFRLVLRKWNIVDFRMTGKGGLGEDNDTKLIKQVGDALSENTTLKILRFHMHQMSTKKVLCVFGTSGTWEFATGQKVCLLWASLASYLPSHASMYESFHTY